VLKTRNRTKHRRAGSRSCAWPLLWAMALLQPAIAYAQQQPTGAITGQSVQALSPEQEPSSSGEAAASSSGAQASPGEVGALVDLIRKREVEELMTVYSGTYGASLFFHAASMTWYVSLFHDGKIWKVVRTRDQRNATTIFNYFAEQTKDYFSVELQRTLDKAENDAYSKQIALEQARAQRLQAELEVARSAQKDTRERQQQAAADISALKAEHMRQQKALRQLQQQTGELQQQLDSSGPLN
jgi:hypothetical protein